MEAINAKEKEEEIMPPKKRVSQKEVDIASVPLDELSEKDLRNIMKGLTEKAVMGNAQAAQSYVKCREYLDRKYANNRETELTSEEVSRIGREVISRLKEMDNGMDNLSNESALLLDKIRAN